MMPTHSMDAAAAASAAGGGGVTEPGHGLASPAVYAVEDEGSSGAGPTA